MSSREKRQAKRRGSTHGSHKCSDGISDTSTSSVGSFMDDTDREVSSLTDRAFRSLCIGEDAIYNDLEVSSPADRHKPSAQEALQNKDLRTTCQESSSYGIQCEEAEKRSEVALTFQHSYVDVAQEHDHKDESLSYISNGSMEAMWQQKRSSSRVSSLIKAFSSGESYCDSGAPDTVKDKHRDFYNESWDKSALLSIQKELSEFSSGYHRNNKAGSLQSYGNHFHSVTRINTATSSKTKFKALNNTNFFFHSEYSPFQLWKDYKRFPFERREPSGFVSSTEFSKWYDSPLYKELTDTHRISSAPAEGRQFTRRKIEDVAASQRSKSTVIQNSSAIEKRCESEMASNCPPWKNSIERSKLPSNRPSTVSPTNEKVHRPDSSLLYHCRHSYEIQHKLAKTGSTELSSRTTPFNISQLLTPVIPGRQETETSEILQLAHTPLVSECDSELRPQSDAKQLRDSYKSKASSLLFNLKDNRKRVKSTYSPTKFKGLEISDRNKQPSNLEGRESRLSDASVSKVQEHSAAPGTWELCNPVQPNYEPSFIQISEHKQHGDNSHNNMALASQYGTTNSNVPYLGSQNSHPDQLTTRASKHYELSTCSGLGNSGSPVSHINGSARSFGPTRMERENKFSEACLSGEMSARETFYRREDAGHQNLVRKPSSGYVNNTVTENLSWRRRGSLNMVTNEMVNINNDEIKDTLPYKGEIAALIELDKQRKATAKQYLPSAKENYITENELCVNNFPRGSEMKTQENVEVCLQRNMIHETSDIETDKPYSQRTQFVQSVEEKYPHNEGSVAYQPYKYESNKQWHIATTENRHTKGEEHKSRQMRQSEMKAEHPGESHYVHALTKTSCIYQQGTGYSARTSQRNLITDDRAKTEEHKPTYSIAPSHIFHNQGKMSTDLNIPNTQRTLQNNNGLQTRGDRFNINDILSVRDNEQAKRIRENKPSFNSTAGEPVKSENLTSPVTSDAAKDIAAKAEPSKFQSQAKQDGNSLHKHENTNMLYGYVRKESHIAHDGKERSGKDVFLSNENDKLTPRALSYKEKGQTKQEILTSKLKAHAQKEISAIKEKGLAKHAILARNPIKQNTVVSNEKEHINQEVLSPKKEITAEKLNHLFHDITYSSVPLYKEQRNQGKDEPKYESLTVQKVELPTRDKDSEKDRTKGQMINHQEEKIIKVDKKTSEFQKFPKNYIHQSNIQSKENLLNKPSEDKEEEASNNNSVVADGTIPTRCFSSSPTPKESIAKKEDETSPNMPTTCTSNTTEHSIFKANGNANLKREVLVRAETNRITLYNITGEAITPESSVNQTKEQGANVNTDTASATNNTASLKFYGLQETTKNKDNTRKENPSIQPNVRQTEVNTRQDKTPSDFMRDEVQAVEMTLKFTDINTTYDKQTARSEQEWEHLQSGANSVIRNNQIVPSQSSPKSSNQMYFESHTESPEKKTWLEKQDTQAGADQPLRTNEGTFLQHQITDVDALKSSLKANPSKELGYQTTLSLNKEASMNLHSSEENNYPLQQEPRISKLHYENSEVPETVSQLNVKIRHENQNQQMIKDNGVTENNSQQLQDSKRSPDTECHNQKGKDLAKEITDTENVQSKHDITYRSSGTKSPSTEHVKSEKVHCMPVITTNSTDQHLSSHPAPEKRADITNPVPESHVIHIASKEDSSPTDEPVIYSICVSSTSEAVKEDEPIIYSISVSSFTDASLTCGPENQEKSQKQPSKEQVEKDNEETLDGKKKESVFLESKEDSKEVKMLLNNNVAEQETVVRNDSPASKDKLDYYRSTEPDNISTSYENLLAEYGRSNGDTIHPGSDLKEQDKKQEDEKGESIHDSFQIIQNNTADDLEPIKKMLTSPDFTTKHTPETQTPTSPEASPEPLRKTEENEHQEDKGRATQRDDGVVCSDRNTQHVSATQDCVMPNVVPAFEEIVDTQAAKQIVANGNVRVEENKQVRQKVQPTEAGLKETDENVVNKNTEMVHVKCENDTQHTAGFSSANICRNSLNYSGDDSLEPSSKLGTDDSPNMIKTQETDLSSVRNSRHAVNQTSHTNSPIMQYKTPGKCEQNSLQQDKVRKEHLQAGDNKTLQNNSKELTCKSEFSETERAKLMACNEVKVSRVIVSQEDVSAVINAQTNENGSLTHNHSKYAQQSVCGVHDIPLKDKQVCINETEKQIKGITVSTRGCAPPKNGKENAQHTTPANVIGTKASSASGLTQEDTERLENEKWTREPARKEREIIKDEMTPLNKDPKAASSAGKGDKDASNQSEKNRKNAKDQLQDKNIDHFKKLLIDNTRKTTEQKESKAGTGTFKESSDIIRWDIESIGKVLVDKHDQLRNVYHPQRNALPERKGSTTESNSNSQHDTVLTKKGGNSTKTEVTHREKKPTRPEISALADYARLRVISAEDDTITEKDLLQKMNTTQKYNFSTVEAQKVRFSMSLGDTEQNKQLPVNMNSENANASTEPLQVQEQQMYKVTDETHAGHNQFSPRGEINTYPKLGSLFINSDDRIFTVKDTESTKGKTLSNDMQLNTKKSLNAQGYSRNHGMHQSQTPQVSHLVQTQIESRIDPKVKQLINANLLEKTFYPQVNKVQSVPQVSTETKLNAKRHADNQIREEVKDEETTEELQYYIVNAMESEMKPKDNHEQSPLSHTVSTNKDLTESHATTPRSTTSSPAMGKPIIFRVKDNTGKTSSITKTVRPRFHRSFSEEFRIGSPLDSCYGSQKDRVGYDHENEPEECANPPILHEQSVTSHRLPREKEIQARNQMLSPGFIAPKEPKGYTRRSRMIQENESRSLIDKVSEEVQSLAASPVVMTDSRGFDTEHIRHTYARPESSCYERPESACYERPESACSDMRPANKPPTVPPKSEKALRRAKRLTSRRISKVEDKMTSDTPVHPEAKSIRTVSSLPASPMVQTSTPQSVHASPPISHYHVEPNSAPSIVAHSFPMTQRKLLQDPNSGQIFMVDMPVQVKTKTFFDPETGKYLQLNVRQRAQSTSSHPAPVEVLGHPYVVYPGFLPMSVSVSSLPSVRSSSQMSAPATLTETANQLKASHEPKKQENFQPECHRNVQQPKLVYKTREQTGRRTLHTENVRMTPRQTHIITMSELEDFAAENT